MEAVFGLYSRLRALLWGQLLVWATKWVTAGFVDLRLTGVEHIQRSVREGRPIILAGWHGHNFLTICSYYAELRSLFRGTTIMVPESANGRVLDHFARRIGFSVVRVDSELGPSQWARATISVIRHVRGGNSVLLAPDGPEGPARQVKPGIAAIGRQTRAVVITGSGAVTRGIRLRHRWDEHLVPLPFSRAVVHFSAPIDTDPADGPRPTVEELQDRIQTALTDGGRMAQHYLRNEAPTTMLDAA